MPALKSPQNDTVEVRALGPTPPPPTKRRIWSQPELASHSLAVLSTTHLYLAPLGGEPRPELLESIKAGGDVELLLGPLATTIDLSGVNRVKLDLISNSLAIDSIGREYSTSRVTLCFTSSEEADACFTKVWRRLGKDVKLAGHQCDKWQLARSPVMMMFLTLAVTAVLALLISVFEDFGSARVAAESGVTATGPLGEKVDSIPETPLEGLIGWMNWKVVCAIGGIIAAVSQVWLYRRLTTPPASLELVRTGS